MVSASSRGFASRGRFALKESRAHGTTGFEPVTFGSGGRRRKSASALYTKDLRDRQKGVVPTVVPSPPEAVFDVDLAEVVESWNELPEVLKAGILATVRVSRSSPVQLSDSPIHSFMMT